MGLKLFFNHEKGIYCVPWTPMGILGCQNSVNLTEPQT